jgi:hypothetical protein
MAWEAITHVDQYVIVSFADTASDNHETTFIVETVVFDMIEQFLAVPVITG